jgi:endonuclease/exonuclease/phosphatase family metal-dependent hydrolase
MVGGARHQALRLATYNVQHGRTPGGEVDIELLARSCAALQADVLGLQEVDVNLRRSYDADTAAAVAEVCGMAFVFGEAIAIRGGRYGNALLVRGVIEDVEVLPIPDAEPRSAIVARAVIDGGATVSVATTHLGLRGAAADELPLVFAAIQRRAHPRAVLGDFNLDPDVVEPLAAAAGFERVTSEATWPAKRPRRTIDHVLLDGLRPTAVVVAPLPVSDHRALVVEVETQ